MYQVGLSIGETMSEALYRECAEAGVAAVELSPAYDRFSQQDYRRIARLARENGVALWSLHLPFWPFSEIDISSTDRALREKSVAYLGEILRQAADVGVDKFIIHPSAEPIRDEDRPARLAAAGESLAALSALAVQCGGVVAVEDLPRTCLGRDSAEILRLLSADEHLRACFDTNHLLQQESPADFARAVGDKILTLHVSDYDFRNERHWLPGEGDVDWNDLLDALDEIGYKGVWMYEVGFDCPASLTRPRRLNCRDFVENAQALFARRAPAALGTRKPDLPYWNQK